MIKITGGKFKGKRLETINFYVRPTASLKREAIFSIIESYSLKKNIEFFKNKIFLDLFSGIGTMGLEGISRGIDKVIFYENNHKVLKVLINNCKLLCKKEEYIIFEEDVLESNINLDFNNISIIYIDPPYNKYNLNNLLNILETKINSETIIIVETSINDNFDISNKLNLIKRKQYGKTNLSFLVLS